MKTALEPYVIDFLRSRGYRYFLPETFTCEDQSTGILLKPCKFKSKGHNAHDSYIQLEKRDYVVMNHGHKEWMWTNIPNDELTDLRKWQIRHYASLQPTGTE